MDYKQTLNLPQTDFPMKANLAQREPEMLKKWEEMGIYQKIRESGQRQEDHIFCMTVLPMPTAIFIWEQRSIKSSRISLLKPKT